MIDLSKYPEHVQKFIKQKNPVSVSIHGCPGESIYVLNFTDGRKPFAVNENVKYIETLNTNKKLMLDLLEANIKAVDMMAANMLNPHTEYPEFERLMKILIEGYK